VEVRTISLKLPEGLDRALDEFAKTSGTSRSKVIRDALERYLGEGGGSIADRARDLAGCLEGPSDLSSGRHHMDGYGR
jgi:metal-responsive CopG/Arc/MetJ family transcriptional regulator